MTALLLVLATAAGGQVVWSGTADYRAVVWAGDERVLAGPNAVYFVPPDGRGERRAVGGRVVGLYAGEGVEGEPEVAALVLFGDQVRTVRFVRHSRLVGRHSRLVGRHSRLVGRRGGRWEEVDRASDRFVRSLAGEPVAQAFRSDRGFVGNVEGLPEEVDLAGLSFRPDGTWAAVTSNGAFLVGRGAEVLARRDGDFGFRAPYPDAPSRGFRRRGRFGLAFRIPPAPVAATDLFAVAENPVEEGLFNLFSRGGSSRVRIYRFQDGRLTEVDALGPFEGKVLDVTAVPGETAIEVLRETEGGGRAIERYVLSGVAKIPPAAPVQHERAPSGRIYRIARSWPTMGTLAEVEVETDDPAVAEEAIEAVREVFDRVDRTMSVYQENSDVVRVNLAAGRESVEVDPWVAEVVRFGREAYFVTRGAFSLTTLAYGVRAGLKPAFSMNEPAEEPAGDEWIRVEDGRIFLEKPGMGIDLGGIAKGFALDKAAEALRARGVTRFLVNLGRSVLAGGPPEGETGWRVRIVGETEARRIERIAISASEQTSASPHIVDPRTGEPIPAGRFAVVYAESGMLSDMASTALVVEPTLGGVLERYYQGIVGWRTEGDAGPP